MRRSVANNLVMTLVMTLVMALVMALMGACGGAGSKLERVRSKQQLRGARRAVAVAVTPGPEDSWSRAVPWHLGGPPTNPNDDSGAA